VPSGARRKGSRRATQPAVPPADVRTILYLVAELARRHNDDIARFHQRLTAAGKPKKVVRIAVAHKLILQLNAKARDARAELKAAT